MSAIFWKMTPNDILIIQKRPSCKYNKTQIVINLNYIIINTNELNLWFIK